MNETTVDPTRDSISARVIEAVAAAARADALALDPPLYEVIDLDALDRLIAGGIAGHVRFEYDEHTITVRGDGTVLVDGTAYEE